MSVTTFNYRFVGIEIISKSLASQSKEQIDGVYSFSIEIKSQVQKEKNIVIELVDISIKLENDVQNLAKFSFAYFFEILNFDEIIKLKENGMYVIPQNLEGYLKAASISTSRGIIFSELRGTYLHNAIMPIIDVTLMEPKENQTP